MIRFNLEAAPILPSLRSFDLMVDEQREEVLDRIEEMVVKPRALLGGEGVVIASEEDTGELEDVVAQVRDRPRGLHRPGEGDRLSTHPTDRAGSSPPVTSICGSSPSATRSRRRR